MTAQHADHDCEAVPKTGVVRLETDAERRRWAKAFDVNDATLMKAVRLVGPSIEALRQLFCRD